MEELQLKIRDYLAEQHPEWSISQEQDTLVIDNNEGLEAFLAVSGEQILIESLLFPVTAVKDPNAFNATVLRTHKLFPLSTVGISTINGDEYYSAFGALSAQSKLESISIEVAALFNNVEAFVEFYQDYLAGA
ncbi:DUF2170 family protein [Dongshaea marina]|uniref:DUF2170 family protein n=1 Tax=Dongshaea marina TaxID=2047966 RepID=UPI000D3E8546|nr:DUF2170 family protein [Dongshaea marina]